MAVSTFTSVVCYVHALMSTYKFVLYVHRFIQGLF